MIEQHPPYKALDIAKYMLVVAHENGDVITNLKLQKLLYYAQAWHLVKKGVPLFEDAIEAWEFGPVVRAVYNEYKEFNRMPIDIEVGQEEVNVLDKETQEYMDDYLWEFLDYSATSLVRMTHEEDPWINVYDKNEPKKNPEITTESMREYYSKIENEQTDLEAKSQDNAKA